MELTIDVSATTATVGLSSHGELSSEITWATSNDHTQRLVPGIMKLLEDGAVKPGDVDLVTVALGPGPFNALRVAVSVAKGWAVASESSLIGINSLEAEVHRLPTGASPVRAVVRAGRSRYITALFEWTGTEWRKTESEDIVEESALDEYATHQITLCGEIEEGIVARLRRLDTLQAKVVSEHQPSRVAILASWGWQLKQAGRTSSLSSLQPVYVRPPHITTPRPRRN
ncbi:MAG: tRNA (adenosine(37)-N6)-threonylcarbamoyltransferase complex dimerization subunit type 1 TsaB [Dehalococcoidia bacterium]|nr:tRNA (adenosine(37)-N6)-threonylcarbamoyltransferase complex dimerization subunit type 1 TsaB [Dehalococcoidia bacterium]